MSRIIRRRSRQSGYVAVLVLIVIAIVTGLSYTMLRSTRTMIAMDRNQSLRRAAREAARSGLEHAIKTMESSDWAGPASNYERSLHTDSGFQVRYQYQENLAANDADYWQQPYRVVVDVTGYATASGRPIEYGIQAEMMLADVTLNTGSQERPPLRMVSTKRDLADNSNDNVHTSHLSVGFWNQILGSLRVEHSFDYWSTLSNQQQDEWIATMSGSERSEWLPVAERYLADHPVDTISNGPSRPSWDSDPYEPPGWTYQIYRGGPRYLIPQLVGSYVASDWQPSAANPWGLVRGTTDVTLGNDVVFRGCLAMNRGASITIQGQNVQMEAGKIRLPNGRQVELPLLLAQNIHLKPVGKVQLGGGIRAQGEMICTPMSRDAHCQITGPIVCDSLELKTWQPIADAGDASAGETIEDWIQLFQLPSQPFCRIEEPATVDIHWPNTNAPLLIPDSMATEGYRWSILSVQEKGFQ